MNHKPKIKPRMQNQDCPAALQVFQSLLCPSVPRISPFEALGPQAMRKVSLNYGILNSRIIR